MSDELVIYDELIEYTKEFILENVADHKRDKFELIEVESKPEPAEFNSRSIEMTLLIVADIRRLNEKPPVSQIEQAILEEPTIELDGKEIEVNFQGTRTYLSNKTWGRQIRILYKYTRNF